MKFVNVPASVDAACAAVPRVFSRISSGSLRALVLAAGLAAAPLASAQVQRTFVNLGFEQPSAGSSTCYFQVADAQVPGWTTNHPSQAGASCAPSIAAQTGPLIEIWANTFNGVNARAGTQFAELNAEAASRIYQNVCLAAGEPIDWRFSHRGRQSATTNDVTEFRVGSSTGTNRVVRAGTQSDGGGGVVTCYANDGGVNTNTCTSALATFGWRDYSGHFTWQGSTGVQAIGFEAVSAAGGATIGNFIDDIQVTLRPFVELSTASVSLRENATSGWPMLRVVGTVPAGGIVVPLTVQGTGTAVRGSDFATTGGSDTFSVTIPAGVYDGNSVALPLAAIDDTLIEDNEFVDIAITASPTNYVLSSTQVCGAAAILSARVTLLDNDVDLGVALDAPASVRDGAALTYTATYRNRTARATAGDATAHDATVSVSSTTPAGLTIHGWTCAASGGARCPGGAPNASVTGSGPIAGALLLPGGAGAAGGEVTFTVGATVTPNHCSAIGLSASLAAPAGFSEATGAQPGFTTPAPNGSSDNTASRSVSVTCNSAPVAQAASVSVTNTTTVAITLGAIDADGDALTYTVTTPPAHGTLSGTAPALTYTPASGYVGSDTFAFSANDGTATSAPATISVTVTAANRAPAFTGEAPTSVDEGATYTFANPVGDPDSGDTQNHSRLNGPDDLAVSASTGAIGWPANASIVGSNRAPNTLCYGGGTTVSAVPLMADVIAIVDESGSMIGEHAWTADFAIPFHAYLTANGIGAGGDANRYGLMGFNEAPRVIPVGGLLMGNHLDFLEATSHYVIPEFGGTEDGWNAIHGALMQYPLRENSSRQVMLITDEDRDAANVSLSYASVLAELQTYKIALTAVVNARFQCGDASVALGLGPDGLGYKADGGGGYVTCTNASAVSGDGTTIADYVNLALATGGTAWDIELLRDGGHMAESFTSALIAAQVREILTQEPTAAQADLYVHDLRLVEGANDVEVIIGNRGLAAVTQAFTVAFAADGNPFAQVEIASLANGATVTRRVPWTGGNPAQISATISAPGTIDCRADNASLAAVVARVGVTDAGGLTDERQFSIGVADVNAAPSIGSTAPTGVVPGDRYVYAVQATDPDRGDALEYTLTTAPSGMTIDRLTGVIRFAPTSNQSGSHAVTVKVADLAGLYATQSYSLSVGAGRVLPRFTSLPNRRAVQGQTYTYAPTVSAAPDAVLSFTRVEGPSGMQVDATSGAVSWGVPGDFAGKSARVALRVNDQFGGFHLQFFTLLGDKPNEPPVFTTQPPTTITGTGDYVYPTRSSDINLFETQTWSAPLKPTGAALTTTPANPAPGTWGRLTWPLTSQTPVAPAGLDLQNPWCSIVPASVRAFQPAVAWRQSSNGTSSQPLVGPLTDTDGNGVLNTNDRIAAVSVAGLGGPRLRAHDAYTGDILWTYTGGYADYEVAPAMADLEGRGQVTILYLDTTRRLVALNGDGTLRWTSSAQAGNYAFYTNAISLADLDRDGVAEILIGPAVFSANGTLRWQYPSPTYEYSRAVALDLDGDGVQEVLYRSEARSATGTLRWKTPSALANETVQHSQLAPIPVAGGAQLGVVVSEQTTAGYRLSLLRSDGTAIWRHTDQSVVDRVGTPLVADFIAEEPGYEIYSAAMEKLFSSQDGRVIWSLKGTQGARRYSGATAAALDGDNDGFLEIYSPSWDGLNRVDARTGVVTARVGSYSYQFQYAGPVPTFADPRGDGQGRLWLGEGGYAASFTPAIGNWAIGARVVHQQAYAADRIGEDMRVRVAMPGVLPAPLYVYGAPNPAVTPTQYQSDLRAFGPYIQGTSGEITLRADVRNRGTLASQPYAVAFYRGTSAIQANRIGRVELPALPVGTTATASLPGLEPSALGSGPLFAAIEPASNENECATGNNTSGGWAFQVAVTDNEAATTTQTWAAGFVQATGVAPTFTTTGPTTGNEQQPYRYDAVATSPYAGDAVTYELAFGPPGMVVDSRRGTVEWTPAWGQTGWWQFTIRATNLAGSYTQQQTWVNVTPSSAPNTAPAFTSTAPTSAIVGVTYDYAAQATDAEGHVITYALNTAPTGMTIEAATGRVRWTPSATATNVPVTVKATDARGAFVTQSFTLNVYPGANRAPVVTSTPGYTAAPASAYAYTVTATDADNDTLTTTWLTVPGGATASGATVNWTPQAAQVGEHTFALEVRDGRGGIASQSWVVFVNDAATNGVPSLSGTPGTNATIAQSYTYAPSATDPDNDTLAWRLARAPAGMTISASTGAIAWTPVRAQVGTHAVRIEVSDGHGGGAWQDYTITAAIDPQNPPPNTAPVIDSEPPTAAKIGRAYRYDVLAHDDDGETLYYSLQQAPAGMTIASGTGRIDWAAAQTGTVEVRVRVADTAGSWAEQSWELTVGESGAMSLNLLVAPNVVLPNQNVNVKLVPLRDAGPLTGTLTLDGQAVALDAELEAVVTAAAPGYHTLSASLNDGVETAVAAAQFFVLDPSQADAPRVDLTAPEDTARITRPTAIRGSIQDADLANWTLTLTDTNGGAPVTLASGTTTQVDAELGTLDPTLRLNGQYRLMLEATDAAGHLSRATRTVLIDGEMKVGHFSITLEDVSLPLAGIPITVTRTYDSRRAHERLDFGYGWTVDYANVRVHESRRLGFGWSLQEYRNGFFANWCVLPNGDPIVTVTLPDGDVERFTARAEPQCQLFVPQTNVNIVFDPQPGTHSSLSQTTFGTVRLIEGNIADPGATSEPIDPSGYRLTTAEGIVYEIDQAFGLKRLEEPNGNTLTFTANGVTHSSGLAVTFERDTLGRITKMVMPDQTERTYGYDTNGDLETATDQVDQVSRYAYAQPAHPHYLKDITDPRQIRVSRSEYDADGRLIKLIDANNKETLFDHAIADRIETVTNRRGHATVYVYDDEGRVLSETNSLNERTEHTYDAFGNELTTTDPRQKTTTRTLDARGNVLTETNPLQQTTTRTYNASNQLLTEVDALQRPVATNTYDERSKSLLTTRDATNRVTTLTYDSGVGTNSTGELRSITDASGAKTTFYPNGLNGWLIAQDDALNVRTYYDRDTLGRVTHERITRTDADGTPHEQVTQTTYDDKGRVVRVDRPDGSYTTTTYTAIDTPHQVCEGTRCTTFVYNDAGQEIERHDPDQGITRKTYDENGNLKTETDRGGRTTKYVYDEADRLTTTIFPDDTPATDADNPFTLSVYDDGVLVSTSDERGKTTTYGYDDAGRQTTVTNALLQTTTTVYDASGRRTKVIDPLLRETLFVYDAAGRLTETIYPDTTTTSTSDNPRVLVDYDGAGRKVAETDPMGRVTRFAYDKAGRLIAVFLPNPTTGANPALNLAGPLPTSSDSGVLVTRYSYDQVGNKLTQTDALSRVTHWRYDDAGRVLRRTLPLGQYETFVYDAFGRQQSHTDFRNRTTSYAYHPNTDWLATIDYPSDTDTTLTYTDDGQIDTVTDVNGTTSYGYDERNRLETVNWPNGLSISYGYDDAGNRTSLTTASQSVSYSYDDLNRLQTVTPTLGGGGTYSYDAVGNRQSMAHVNGITTTYGYNPRNQLTTLTTSKGSTIEQKFTYTLDKNGQRLTIHETYGGGLTASQATYTYDAVKRLSTEYVSNAGGNRSVSWVYDKVGNRLSEARTGSVTKTTTYTYDDNDRLTNEVVTGTGAGTTTYTYDPAGNLTQKDAPGGIEQYVYDDANRMRELIAANQEVTRYAYNHNGIRIGQTANATGSNPVTTHYLVDPNQAYAQVLEEHTQPGSGTKTLAALYVFGDDRISQHRPAIGGAAASTRHYHADGLGSTRLLTNTTGTITDRYHYQAFGELDTAASTMPSDNRFLFTGEQLDPNTGFYYLRARYMSPASGRFIHQDSFAGIDMRPMSLNKYLYADSDPSNKTDPSGHMSLGETSAAQNIQSSLTTLATRTHRIVNTYDRVQSVLDFFTLASELRNVVGHVTSLPLPSSTAWAIPSVNYAEAAENFAMNMPRAIGTGIGNWAAGYVSSSRSSTLTAFLIHMPMPAATGAVLSVPTGMKITFGRQKIPVNLVFGSKTGADQLFGIGMEMGIRRQLIRMDYHTWNPKHGGKLGVKPGELAAFRDDPFHYHVRKWNQ